MQQSRCWSCSNRAECFQRQSNTPDTTLRPGVLGRELTSLTSVSSDVLPSPEQLSSSCSLSSCFKSGASTKGRQWRVERKSIITQCHAPLIFTYRRKWGMCWFSALSSKLTQTLQQDFSYILLYRMQDSAQVAMFYLHGHSKKFLLFQVLYFLNATVSSQTFTNQSKLCS